MTSIHNSNKERKKKLVRKYGKNNIKKNHIKYIYSYNIYYSLNIY